VPQPAEFSSEDRRGLTVVEIPSDVGAYARWVRPELVGAIEYRELGVTLGHPSWKCLQADTDSAFVTFA
jgi:hypothetical protein